MPYFIYALALAVFAQGTSEFMLSGLVPDIAADLGVSIAASGMLTSAFAIGMVVGAPLVAVLSMHWRRRSALLTFLVVFIAMHVIGATTPHFAVLAVSRVVSALANAGFLAVALATATSVVPANRKGRTTAVLLSGVTLACVVGVPGGTIIGETWGWRATFWSIVIVCLPAVAAMTVRLPDTAPPRTHSNARQELSVLRLPAVRSALTLGALVNAATFCTFTYLAVVATQVTGLSASSIPGVLALFGFGAFVGVTISGRYADTRPHLLLGGGMPLLLAGWILLALTAGSPAIVLVLAVAQGALSFGVGSTLITRVQYATHAAPTLGGAFATSALNVGAAIGPMLGGLAIETTLGFRGPLWTSSLLVAMALPLGYVVIRRELHPINRPTDRRRHRCSGR